MAMSRYEERKSYEVLEANAISTEYLRADLLSATDAAKVQSLLRDYLDQRILFYTARRNEQRLRELDAHTAQLQTELWAAVHDAVTQPTPTIALAVAGMNDVLNSQGYAQAAWWNRIPTAAWILMALISRHRQLTVWLWRTKYQVGEDSCRGYPLSCRLVSAHR